MTPRLTFRGAEMTDVWLALGDGAVVGAYEVWWDDEAAYGVQPPVAGYVHRLMVRRGARPETGGKMLAAAERRMAQAGRVLSRLDCVTSNPRLRTYYEGVGYTPVGELAGKVAADGGTYGVLLMEKPVG
ncbi:hypothetical protein [Streptomyces flavofungini]|uniref:hypothetical protein n=1 Tax=Streptomyces flavofungini TaxID=68200 RepID=UPI003F820A2D